MGVLKTLIDKLKIKEIIGITFLAALTFTILPINMLEYLKLLELKEKYQVYISLCLIITSMYYMFNFLGFMKILILNKIFDEKKLAIKYMKNYMSADEMRLIIESFYDYTNKRFKSSAYIEFGDGRISPLESKKVIYRASTIAYGISVAYNLQPYVLEFLNNNLKEGNIEINENSFSFSLV